MKTYQFKNLLFEYFNENITAKFAALSGKVFRERLKIEQPKHPYVMLKSGERIKINKRYENFYSDETEYTRVQYRLPITFSVHSIESNPMDAEEFSDEVIDYIEAFFEDDENTHVYFQSQGVVINELLCSGVRDSSSFSNTAQEFVKEIDIVFEYEDLRAVESVAGEELDVNILPSQN